MSSNENSIISQHSKFLLSENPMKVLLRLSLPIEGAEVAYYLRDIISVYFQTMFFGSQAVLLEAVEQPLIAIFGEAMPNALMMYYVIEGTHLMADNNVDLLRVMFGILELDLNITSVLFLVIILFSIRGLISVFGIDARFHATMIGQVFMSYLFAALNETNQLKFISENRRLLALSQAVVTCLIELAPEALIYQAFSMDDGSLVNNWPTIVSYTISGLVVSIWLLLLLKNFTALGVINRNPFTITLKDILNFSRENMKIQLKYVTYSLPRLVSLISAPLTVLLCIDQIERTFENVYDEYSAISDLFMYWHIGGLCRIASYSLSECTICPLELCYKKQQWKRVNQVIWASISMCILENIFIGAIFYVAPLQRIFIADSEYQTYYIDNGNAMQVIIISSLAGSLSIIPEISILISNIEGNYILPMLLSICKIIMGTLAAILLGNNNGNRANFMIPITFMELSSCFLGLLLVVIYSIKFAMKENILDKAQKNAKKPLLASRSEMK